MRLKNATGGKISRYMTVLAIMFASLSLVTSCDDEMKISYNKLPSSARAFIETYFPGSECVYAEKERDDGQTDYKAVLDNGTEIEFNSSGEWTSVDCKFSIIPTGIVPLPIVDDIAERYPEAGIYKVERKLGGYEISIGNGLKLIYSSDGRFVREDRF